MRELVNSSLQPCSREVSCWQLLIRVVLSCPKEGSDILGEYNTPPETHDETGVPGGVFAVRRNKEGRAVKARPFIVFMAEVF